MSGKTLLLDITMDGIKESPLRIERLTQHGLKRTIDPSTALSAGPPPPRLQTLPAGSAESYGQQSV
jgi:hypothetical protein